MHYEWTNAYVEGADTMGHTIPWYTDTAPEKLITTESPSGPGDILVRAELFVQTGYYSFNTSPAAMPNVIGWPCIYLAGEVYSVGAGGFPDPHAANSRAQLRASYVMPGMNYLDHNGNPWAVAQGSTPGFVTSKGIRSPAEYGAGHPEYRVGVWCSNIGTSHLLVGTGEATWSASLACLWKVP